MNEPRAEYAKRLAEHDAELAACEARHEWFGNAKLAVIGAGIVAGWFVVARQAMDAHWLWIAAAGFVALAVGHEWTLRKRRAAQSGVALYRRGIARIEDKWVGTGSTGEAYREKDHVYAEDLDLFGRGCLFELLSTARLPMGEKKLAEWLQHGASAEEIRERQELVKELREKLDLHRDLAIVGEELRARLAPERVLEWGESETFLARGLRLPAGVLAAAAVAALVYYGMSGVYWPLLSVLLTEGVLRRMLEKRAKNALMHLDCNAEGLLLFSRILERLEREPFEAGRLKELAAELKDGGEAASHAMRKLARIMYWVDGRESLLGKILEWLIVYTAQVAFAAESWKKRHGRKLRRWMAIAGEMEALISLGTYAYEHPGDEFPEVVDARREESFFDGEALGHPLLAAEQCVRNSVRLDGATRVLLVSGSNMSGKSTLLRTVGINAVLAMAGAPVRAGRLRMTPLLIGTRIRSSDSLQEGRSNFYTEILHIKRVFELAEKEKALLFLFDELLDGTNSHDRRIGAEKLLRTLAEAGAMGMVTTHDLALTEIDGAIGAEVKNVHFEDNVERGKMRFDYRLREGVVTKGNAIELMRIVGLDV
ncbi:MAG: MutS family DNA mismatch repair protein [Candidatus Acidiferrum sp.]